MPDPAPAPSKASPTVFVALKTAAPAAVTASMAELFSAASVTFPPVTSASLRNAATVPVTSFRATDAVAARLMPTATGRRPSAIAPATTSAVIRELSVAVRLTVSAAWTDPSLT